MESQHSLSKLRFSKQRTWFAGNSRNNDKESIVRTLIALTFVSWIACPAAIFACCSSHHEKNDETVYLDLTPSPVPSEEGAFHHDWMLAGVEEFTWIRSTGEDKASSKSENASDVRDQLYAGMWSSLRSDTQRVLVQGCWGGTYYLYLSPPIIPSPTILPPTIPPFDSGWLTEVVWPRTRAHLNGEFDSSACFFSCCGEVKR
jgi:hypothetical protein